MTTKLISLIPITLFLASNNIFAISPSLQYSENNHARVSFDVSMPIDATGYTLHGKNLTGGNIQFTDQGKIISPLLSYETGHFELPVATSAENKPLIKTNINYKAIKFINPNGIDNLFIKVGVADRTQTVSGLGPYVLKDGTYTWQVPIFSVGKESNDVNNKSENWQLMQVGTGKGPSQHNGMYDLEFNLYSMANGDTSIAGHPQNTAQLNEILSHPYTTHFNCHADGMWGGGGSDPYRTIENVCHGSTTTFPAGPNLDYEYGTLVLPTISSPWTASPADHCIVNGERKPGCTNVKIKSTIHYIAQTIRVRLQHGIFLTASAGTLYRQMNVHNLRYQCQVNVYLKKILPTADCAKKSYLPGGWSAPYFSVGYQFTGTDGAVYSARYIYTPEKENSNRIAWRDASSTRIYLVSVSKKESPEVIRKNFNAALHIIQKIPDLDAVLVNPFFADILKQNNLYVKS